MDHIEVIYFHKDQISCDVDAMVHTLTPQEFERHERLAFPHLKRDWILSRGGLRILLGNILAQDPASLHFEKNRYSKPRLKGSELQFNVSHSGDYIVYAFTQHRELGIDIEKTTPNFASHRLATRYFSEAECQSLNNLTEKEFSRAFYAIWSRKEAYIKAIGMGLSADLKAFSVDHQSSRQSFESPTLCMEALHLAEGYASAICYHGETQLPITIRKLTSLAAPMLRTASLT
ncbi:4'-phosphopantetheinyl transferase family protein [Rubritalea marina]|uniref:4'-phosphopantetheinyl transferase family protein n=1 Tax=Rubritalea marina TaxID=361055 RepID=UPI00036DE319|nr:4'-phosphopantetheinyl transferase superfamily protein [Rubritalea marina]